MFNMKCLQIAGVCLAALGFGFTGTQAMAGPGGAHRADDGVKSQRSCNSGYDRGYGGHHGYNGVSVSYHDRNFGVSVSYDSSRHYRSGHYGHYDRGYRHVRSQPSGYWTSVYRPPIYETRYLPCGTPYRVCVRAGYYERVWVSTCR